jgi:hypothetical protein
MLSAKEQEFKQQQMLKYKQDLDTQLQARQYMKAYGNMSNIEK